MSNVKDAVFDVLRAQGLTRIYANPGSTEVALLTDLPEDLEFILALHEGSVIGMATGDALASGRPALALLHTTAGLGNAVGAIATARANRAPLVILVGQQDRRHLASEPFLAGRLRGLAGDYPVAVHEPSRAADLPGRIAQAAHDAATHRGPALVIVPMDDWDEPADDTMALPAPSRIVRTAAADQAAVDILAAIVDGAENPVIVTGSGIDSDAGWVAIASLAEQLDCPVWQEAQGSRAAFDQTSPRFAGHLPPARDGLRKVLAPHDVVVVIGGPAFKQYLYIEGAFVEPGTTVVVVTDDADEARMSAADTAVLCDVAPTIAALAASVRRRDRREWQPRAKVAVPPLPTGDEAISPLHVFAAIAERLPAESTLIEECPSTRRQLIDLIPTRAPFGFTTPAMGGLGFALPAATGIKIAKPNRPVVAIVGDGSSLYNVQALWSAARYQAGVLFIVMSNGGYAVMDRLADLAGGKAPWPGFAEVSVSTIATGLGCPTQRIETYADLIATLDRVIPTLAERREPLLLDIAVSTI